MSSPLDEPDDFGFLGDGISHSSSPPSVIMLFKQTVSKCQVGHFLQSRSLTAQGLDSSVVATQAP